MDEIEDLLPGMQPRFRIRVANVLVYGSRGDEQLGGDFLLRMPLRIQRYHLRLTLRKLVLLLGAAMPAANESSRNEAMALCSSGLLKATAF